MSAVEYHKNKVIFGEQVCQVVLSDNELVPVRNSLNPSNRPRRLVGGIHSTV